MNLIIGFTSVAIDPTQTEVWTELFFDFLHLLFFAVVPSVRVEATGGDDTSKSYLLMTRCVA